MTRRSKPARLLFPGITAKMYDRIKEALEPKKKAVRRSAAFQSAATRILPGWDR